MGEALVVIILVAMTFGLCSITEDCEVFLFICLFAALFAFFDYKDFVFAKFAPCFASDSAKLSLKIDELKDIKDLMRSKYTDNKKLKERLEKQMEERSASYSNAHDEDVRNYLLSLYNQEKEHSENIRLQNQVISKTVLEVSYMIEYAQNNLNMLENDFACEELLEKLNDLKLKASKSITEGGGVNYGVRIGSFRSGNRHIPHPVIYFPCGLSISEYQGLSAWAGKIKENEEMREKKLLKPQGKEIKDYDHIGNYRILNRLHFLRISIHAEDCLQILEDERFFACCICHIFLLGY